MAKLLKLRRGTTTQHGSFTGAEGEVTVDTDKETLVVHDGSTAGGHPVAAEDLANVSSSTIAGRLSNDSITTSKLAAGALPSDVTVASANLVDGTIVNADVNGSAAIAGTKISPDFGSQNIETSGTVKVDGSVGDTIIKNSGAEIEFTRGASNNITCSDSSGSLNINTGGSNTRMTIAANGQVDFATNVDCNAGIDVTGNMTVTGTVDGRDVASDGSKLDGIESGATADQSASEILTAVKTVDGVGSGLNADLLDNMHASDTASNSTVVARNASGYIFANYFNTTPNDVTSGTITKVCVETGNDGYIRHADPTSIRSFINVENGATADQSGSEIATALQGQTLGNSSNGVHNIYCDDWFRNNDSGDGMYNQSTAQHWYSDSAHYWNVAGSSSHNGIRFRAGHSGTIHGYVYANSSADIGFLNSGGSWSLKCDSSGNVTATGNVTAYSDARLKTDIHTINDALSICGKLRGVSYKWIADGKPSIGVIAQEVEEVLPEVVLTQQVLDPTGEKEVKSVDYGKIVGVLINAINELKAEVDELKGGK